MEEVTLNDRKQDLEALKRVSIIVGASTFKGEFSSAITNTLGVLTILTEAVTQEIDRLGGANGQAEE